MITLSFVRTRNVAREYPFPIRGLYIYDYTHENNRVNGDILLSAGNSISAQRKKRFGQVDIRKYVHTTLKPELYSHASARCCDRVVLLPECRVRFSLLYYKSDMHTRLLSQNSTLMLVLGAATVSCQLLPEWRVRFSLYYKRNGNVIGGEFLCERGKSRNG